MDTHNNTNNSDAGEFLDLSISKESTHVPSEVSLIAKIYTDKRINLKVTKEILASPWEANEAVDFSTPEQNTLLCAFTNEKDRAQVIQKEPWSLKKKIMFFSGNGLVILYWGKLISPPLFFGSKSITSLQIK